MFSKNLQLLIVSCLFCLSGFISNEVQATQNFIEVTVDNNGPVSPWGKTTGDINGDGKLDLVVGGHSPRKPKALDRVLFKLGFIDDPWSKYGSLVWYENPTWHKHYISREENFRTDLEVADIDNDGKNDVISLADNGLIWFKSPNWQKYIIDTKTLHDVEVADFDRDGDQDIVARNQSLFGHDDGNTLHFYRQDTPEKWTKLEVPIHHGEGLAVADLNQDNLPDVIVNQKWYRNPGTLEKKSKWLENTYCPSWKWLDAFIDIADLNGNGQPDIVLSPAEPVGSYYRISWCEAPANNESDWIEHIVDSRVESVYHSIRAGDFNNDNLMDILAAEMPQGKDPDEVSVYWQNQHSKWQKEIISTQGSHSMRILDANGDGLLDFYGANWSGENEDIKLWLNKKKMKRNGDDM